LRDNKAVISFESECSIYKKDFKKLPKERIKSKKGNFIPETKRGGKEGGGLHTANYLENKTNLKPVETATVLFFPLGKEP
jgi:hypothetical protein